MASNRIRAAGRIARLSVRALSGRSQTGPGSIPSIAIAARGGALVEVELACPRQQGDRHDVLRGQAAHGPFLRLEHCRARLLVLGGDVNADDVEPDCDLAGVHFGVPVQAAEAGLLSAVQVVGTFQGSGTALSAVRLALTVMTAAAAIPITPGRISRTRMCLTCDLVLRTVLLPRS
jgi:hypothetical protein